MPRSRRHRAVPGAVDRVRVDQGRVDQELADQGLRDPGLRDQGLLHQGPAVRGAVARHSRCPAVEGCRARRPCRRHRACHSSRRSGLRPWRSWSCGCGSRSGDRRPSRRQRPRPCRKRRSTRRPLRCGRHARRSRRRTTRPRRSSPKPSWSPLPIRQRRGRFVTPRAINRSRPGFGQHRSISRRAILRRPRARRAPSSRLIQGTRKPSGSWSREAFASAPAPPTKGEPA